MYTVEKWSLNNKKLITKRASLQTFDSEDLFKKCPDRIGFENTKEAVTIPTYMYRVNGIFGEEDDLYDKIFSLKERLARQKSLFLFFDKGLERRLDNNTIQYMQTGWERLERENSFSSEKLMNAVKSSGALKRFTDAKHTSLVLNSIKNFFDEYYASHHNSIRPHEIKNILIHIVCWINVYAENLLREFDFAGVNPKVMYYGVANKREGYFLLFLSFLGADVIYINTESNAPFDKVDPDNALTNCGQPARQLPLKPFPNERINARVQTDAYSASEELRETLHSEDSMFYRPWQLVDYSVQPLKLISTYEEIGILAQEQALMRNGWEVFQGIVTIPSFFSKILGVKKDVNQYYHDINSLIKLPKTKFYDSLPISKKVTSLLKKEYYAVCGRDGLVNVDKLVSSDFWPYKSFQKHVQMLIASSVREFCTFKGIKRQKQYGVDEQKLVIFTTLMRIDDEMLQLLQMFDYPKEVPKCIIYNNEKNGDLIFEDSILIYFFSSVGMDVFIFNPAGRNDVEIYLDDSIFNTHHLEEMAFNLPFKSFSVFGKYIR